jgi:hypothetical protein
MTLTETQSINLIKKYFKLVDSLSRIKFYGYDVKVRTGSYQLSNVRP